MRIFTAVIYLFLITAFISCSKSIDRLFCKGHVKQTRSPAVDAAVHKTNDYVIGGPSKKQIRLRYLGCGGYYIAASNNGLLIDPYFSNRKFMWVFFPKMRTKTANVTYGLEGLKDSISKNVNGIFVTHSHYDHLLDVPYVYDNFTNKERTTIYTSSSGANMMANVVSKSHVVNMQSKLVCNSRQQGQQYPLGKDSSIWVTPILSDHAPHYKKISFFKGESKPVADYDKDTDPTWACDWKLGSTYAFLIDFMGHDKKIEYRIFIMSSAAPPKYGWLPKELLDQHPVNLAILGAASFEYVSDYPEGIVDHLKPEKIIICHWEDFFNSYLRKKKRTVRFTNIKKFICRLNNVYPYMLNSVEQFSMPDPKTNIIINY